MNDDPVIREIREYRDQLAQRFKDDDEGFFQWLKQQEEKHRREGWKYVSRPPKRVPAEATAQH
jgi:hypothetical protein